MQVVFTYPTPRAIHVDLKEIAERRNDLIARVRRLFACCIPAAKWNEEEEILEVFLQHAPEESEINRIAKLCLSGDRVDGSFRIV